MSLHFAYILCLAHNGKQAPNLWSSGYALPENVLTRHQTRL